MADNDYTISSVIKALKTLKHFDTNHREMTLTELSRCSDMTKSSMLRILASLQSENFVRYDEETKKYKLGIEIFNLGNTAFDFLDVKKIAAPILKRAAIESQLLIHLAVMENDEIIVIDKIWPADHFDMIALVSYVGGSVPVHCTGVGKVLAAYASEKVRNRLISKCDFHVYTERTISNKEDYIKELDKVKRNGYAFNDCEHEKYLRCLTRPIFDGEGKVIAAVSISGLRDVMTDDKIGYYNLISEGATRELSREFGFYH